MEPAVVCRWEALLILWTMAGMLSWKALCGARRKNQVKVPVDRRSVPNRAAILVAGEIVPWKEAKVHVLTHGLLAGILISLIFTYWAKDRVKVWWLTLSVFHLHLLCDFLGSGIDWPIQYFWPFSETFYHTPYGWELDAWQNWAAAIPLLLVCGRLAIRSGHSFAETILPAAGDQAVVAALRQRFASAGRAYVARPGAETP